MENIITNRGYFYFLIVGLSLLSYDLIKKIIVAQSTVEFYLECVMLIFTFAILFAIINKHRLLSKLIGVWSIMVMLVSFTCACVSLYCFFKYPDYKLQMGFRTVIFWNFRFLVSCVILWGSRKWVKIIDSNKPIISN